MLENLVFMDLGIKTRIALACLLPACLLLLLTGSFVSGLLSPAELLHNYSAMGLLLLALILASLPAIHLGRRLQQQLGQLRQAVDSLGQAAAEQPPANLSVTELDQLASAIRGLQQTLTAQQQSNQQQLMQSREDARQHRQTAEVQRIELDMARKESRAASRARNSFLANMSHEIRTPLNGILGFSQLLHKTALNTQQQDHLQTIQRSAENLLDMLDQALDTSRLEAGNLRLDSQPFELRELINDCLSVVALAAHEKQLELVSMVYRDTPPRLLGDPPLLKQILIYLLGTAIRLTPRGSIVLRAMLEDECSEFARLRISLQGSATDMQTDALQHVLQAFDQPQHSPAKLSADSTTGLSIARFLTQLMGGEIGVQSTPDAGTELWICISLAKAAERPAALPGILQGQRIAIFEEHPLARQSLLHQLLDYGMEVLVFEHLDELLQAVAEQQHDTQPITLAVLGTGAGTTAEQLDLQLRALQQHDCKTLVLCPVSAQGLLHTASIPDGCRLQPKPAHGRRMAHALEELLEPPPAGSQPPHQPLLPDEQAPRVLCVDDNPANLLLVQSLLSGLGVRVTAVDSGHAALEATDAQRFDLILMDIRMPGMDGLQASMAIRQREQQQQRMAVPIIALTAHVLPNQKRSLLQAGMNDLLSKPIAEAQLAGLLSRWVGKQLHSTAVTAASPATDTLAILDHHEGLRLAGGKKELASDLLGMLLASLDGEQQAIARARAGNNAGELAERVHHLLGATRYCGVPQLRTICQHCENLLREGDSNTAQALDQLDLAITRLQHVAGKQRMEITG
jgi:two-component system sensor histidine kinase BarA